MQHLDGILVEEAKQDPAAFGALVQRYQDGLFNFLYRMTGSREDAQDLTQEVFLRIYKALPRFRIEAPFRPWMYKIATNAAINHLKSKRTTNTLEEEYPTNALFSSPEGMAELREAQRAVKRALMELPESYRAVILMRHLEELSYEEMAHALDIPLGTAKVRLHRARSLLQEKLSASGIKEGDHELHSSSKAPSALS